MKQKLYMMFAGLFLLSAQVKAQAPFAFNYQGVARNAAGAVLPNQTIALRFTIHQAAAGGAIQYQETQTDSTNQFGLFTANVGFGTLIQGSFPTIAWGNGTYFLQVEMDATGTGTNYIDMGAQQLLSVPYALYAANSGGGGSGLTSVTALAPIYIIGTATAPVVTIQGLPSGADAGGVLYSTGANTSAVFTPTGVAGQVLTSNGTGAPTWVTSSGSGTAGWSLTGNSGTTAGINFIGTTDAKDFVVKTNDVEHVRVTSGGNVGVGTSAPATDAGIAIKGLHLEAQAGATAATVSINPIHIGIGGSGSFNDTTGGNDVGGEVSITTGGIGSGVSAGQLILVNFGTPYTTRPAVVITPADATTASAIVTQQPYVVSTTAGFSIYFVATPAVSTTYNFNYFVVEAK